MLVHSSSSASRRRRSYLIYNTMTVGRHSRRRFSGRMIMHKTCVLCFNAVSNNNIIISRRDKKKKIIIKKKTKQRVPIPIYASCNEIAYRAVGRFYLIIFQNMHIRADHLCILYIIYSNCLQYIIITL